MILASLSMLNNKKPHFDSDKQKCNYLWIAGEGLIVGGVTGSVGAGGGFIIVPALVVLIGLPIKVAVGTSMMIIAVKALYGFFWGFGNSGDSMVISFSFLKHGYFWAPIWSDAKSENFG